MAAEAFEGPDPHERWARLPSHKPKATEERLPDQPSDEDVPPFPDQVAPAAAVKWYHRTGAGPGSNGVSCGDEELILGAAEGLPGNPPEAAPPLRQLRVLRRSMSWPEGLSRRDTTERGNTESSPDKAAILPGEPFGLAEPEKPGVEVTVASVRQVALPTVRVSLADSDKAPCPENKPCGTPSHLHSCKPDLPDGHSTANGFRALSKVPRSSLKRFTLNFQWRSSRLSEGPEAARPKRRGGRRFGRSLSHESGLPLQAEEEEEAGSAAMKKGATSLSPKSPLQSFKAYGRQIFIAHKHWAMAFAGRRGRKESVAPSHQETERAAEDAQELLSGHQTEGERCRYSRSPKFPSGEPLLVVCQDSLDF